MGFRWLPLLEKRAAVIIGRGTRIEEGYGKTWFTIMDFKGATRLFADPDFDGEPVQIYEPEPDDPPTPPEDRDEPPSEVDPPPDGRPKYHVANVPARIVREQTLFMGGDGKLSTESVKDFTRKTVRGKYALFDDFLNTWSQAEQKREIVRELEEQGNRERIPQPQRGCITRAPVRCNPAGVDGHFD